MLPNGSSLFLVFIVEVLCISFSQELPELKGPVLPYRFSTLPGSFQQQGPSPLLQAERPLIEDGSGSIQSSTVPPVVESFASNFMGGILSDVRLLTAFDIKRLTANEASDIIYREVYGAHSSVGDPAPESIAQKVTEAVKQKFENITAVSFLKVFGYSIGKLLHGLGMLTPENVQDLSQKYFEMMKSGINSGEDSSPQTDMRGLSTGYLSFLNSLGLYEHDSATNVAEQFINEFYNLP